MRVPARLGLTLLTMFAVAPSAASNGLSVDEIAAIGSFADLDAAGGKTASPRTAAPW